MAICLARAFRELRLQRVSRDFGMNNALKDMTLTVKRGEFIALLDPSLGSRPQARPRYVQPRHRQQASGL